MEAIGNMNRANALKTTPDLNGLAGWVLSVLSGWRGERDVPKRQMRLVETLALGGKRHLMLVSCGSESYLVGGGPESVEAIVRVKLSLEAAVKSVDETCL
jgi:flagellar biogenesis protein FliO